MTEIDEQRPVVSDFLPEVTASCAIYAGRVINVREDRITLRGGGTASREVVDHRGAIVVAAIDAQNWVYMVRQYRHPIRRYLLEFPAGTLEPDEEPLVAAVRELREEVGLEAKEWIPLGFFYSSPGFANERLYGFVARDLVSVVAEPDDDEDISVVRYPLVDVLRGIPEVNDAKTLAMLFWVERILEGKHGRIT